MANRFLRYFLIIYTFLLPVQTRLFLVDSGVEYQRVSLYATQLIFIVILFGHGLYRSLGWTSNVERRTSNVEARPNLQSITCGNDGLFVCMSSSTPAEVPETKNKQKESPFGLLFSVLDSGRNAGMTIFLFFVFLIGTQFIITSRFDLTLQVFLWILQTILFVWIVKRENAVRPVLWSFIASMCLQSITIWLQVFTQHIPGFAWLGLAEQMSSRGGVSVIETSIGRFLRGYGTFPHPNIAGGYLLVAILAMRRLPMTKSQLPKMALSALLVSALVLTFSRSAMAGLLIVVIASAIEAIVNRFRNEERSMADGGWWSLVVVLSCLAVVVPFRDLVFSRVNISHRLESASLVERAASLSRAREIVKNHFWFGVGLGNYTVEIQKKDPNQPLYSYQPPHNVIALAFSEAGIVGVMFVVLCLWMMLRGANHESRIPKAPSSPLDRGGNTGRDRRSSFLVPFPLVLGLLPPFLFDHYLLSLYSGGALVGVIVVSLGVRCDAIHLSGRPLSEERA